MKFTNKYGLPEIVEKFIIKASTEYDGPTADDINRISVTTLLDSPYIRQLKRIFWDDIEVDVRSRQHMVLGTMAHTVMEQISEDPDIHGGLKVIQEKRLEVEFFGGTEDHMILSGQFDKLLIGKDAHLVDVKTSGAYSMTNKEKRETYEQQVNIYRYMIWKTLRIDTKSASLFMIAKDWQQTAWQRAKDAKQPYPKSMFDEYQVRIAPYDVIEKFIEKALKRHVAANRTGIDTTSCTEKERWSDPMKWAVIYVNCQDCGGIGWTGDRGCEACGGSGNPKRSIRNFESKEDAEAMLFKCLNEGEEVCLEPRYPVRINMRCKDYCDCSAVCPYYQAYLKEQK